MARSYFDEVSGFLQQLGFTVRTVKHHIIGSKLVMGTPISYSVRVEDRGGISQLPAPSVYVAHFDDVLMDEEEDGQVQRWAVVPEEALATERCRDLVRAGKSAGIRVGSLSDFLDAFVSRTAIQRYLQETSSDSARDMNYVPQRIADAQNQVLEATDALLAWIRQPGAKKLGIIHAPAGHGKTVFTERFANQLVREALRDRTLPTPFLVKFADHQRVEHIDDLLLRALDRAGIQDLRVEPFKTLIKRGRVVLLFDGLDELSEEAGERIGLDNVRRLSELVRKDSDGRVLVTTRSTFLDTGRAALPLLDADPLVWELLPFDEHDKRKFLEQNPPIQLQGSDIGPHRDRVMTLLSEQPEIEELSGSPFLLSLISKVVAERPKALPKNIEQLYERFVLSLCERELRRQHHGISAERQTGFLELVAHDMVVDQVFSYPPDLFQIEIDEYFHDEIVSDNDPARRRTELVAKFQGSRALAPINASSAGIDRPAAE